MKSLPFLEMSFPLLRPFRVVGDEVVETETETKVDPPVDKPNKVTFTPEQQAFINSKLAEEKRKGKEQTDKVILQLETTRNQAGTTAAEKERLESQIEDLKSAHLTEKELTDKERKKAESKKDTELKAAKDEAEKWRKNFFDTGIRRQLVDAASVKDQKATNPQHVVALLERDTRLVEEVDEDNQPTGNWIAKTKIRTTKDGKPVTLEMTATEAVKFLSEQEEHEGLFVSGATGGLGSTPRRPGKDTNDPNKPPTDHAAYLKWRAANPTAVGASPKRTSKQM